MSDVIRHAERVAALVQDEVVQAAFAALKEVNYRAFVSATTDEDRRMAQAKAVVLGEFEAALQGVVDAGTMAKHQLEQRDRAPLTR